VPFSSVVGHSQLVGLLKQAVLAKRVPQSLLFAGPDGVGKRTVALALAQAINCGQPAPDGDACGRCNACVRITKGQYADVVVVDKGNEASIKIQALRTRILDAVGYRPFEGARRVFIIEPADAMTEQAQDALLKTLEEPPPSAVIILVTAFPDLLLATIRSRCRKLRFGPLAERDVERVLVERAGVDAVAARRRSAASSGSVSRALAVEEDEFEEDRRVALDLVAAAARGSVSGRLQAAAAFAKHAAKRRAREAAGARVAIVFSILRDLATLSSARSVPVVNADLEDRLAALAAAYPLARLTTALDTVGEAQAALGRNASPKIVADWLSVSL
jgi:DNA polymerase-3 subunit delta'